MSYVSGKCPNCGGDIQLDDSKDKGFCMHCGSQVSVKEASQTVKIDSSNQVVNLTRLGFRKYDEGAIEEAHVLFKQALMLDCNCKAAFFGEKITQHDIGEKLYFASGEYSGKYDEKYEELDVHSIGSEIVLVVANDKTYNEEHGFKLALGNYLLYSMKDSYDTASQNDIEIIPQLLRSGADLTVGDYFGSTVLFYSPNANITKILIEYGADPFVKNHEGTSVFQHLLWYLNVEVIKVIIQHGVKVDATDEYGMTALHGEAIHKNEKSAERVKLLVDIGADVNAKTQRTYNSDNFHKKVKYTFGENMNPGGGYTPLHFCCNKEVAKILIEYGADVNAKDNEGKSPLFYCVNSEIEKILIEHGAVGAEINKEINKPKKEGCYIATAVYGSYEAQEVLVLRRFRDEVLSQSISGRVFIKLYYTFSPGIARWLKDARNINVYVKNILDKIVKGIEK